MISIVKRYDFIMEHFEDKNIIEPLMATYHDFNYVNYILDLEFYDGYTMYYECIQRIKRENESKNRDDIYKLWLVEIQGGNESSFEDYYNTCKTKSENTRLSFKARSLEEKNIIDKIEKIDDKKIKMKERKII